MNGWPKKEIDRMQMYQLLGKIYIQTVTGFGKMGLAKYIRENGGDTVKTKYNFVAKALVRSGLLTKQGKKGRGIAYKWNIKDFGPVSIPIAEAMISETERQIRIGASIKYYNKKARTLANLAEND